MLLITSLVIFTLSFVPVAASAWNAPGHMLSAAVAYQVLRQENPQVIDKVKAVLEKHPWYVNQWQSRLQAGPVADHSLALFMQAEGGQTIFVPTTSSGTVRRGTISMGRSTIQTN